MTGRGVDRCAVFRDDADRELFVRLLRETVEQRGWRVWAWCLMTTHYHLVVQAPRGDLSAGMQWLKGRYAQTFNRRHGRSGHLWQGRFHSLRVEHHAHLAQLSRYIARNPVDGGLCGHAADWPWSHHRGVLGLEPLKVPDVGLLRLFHRGLKAARRAYAAFVGRRDAPDGAAPAHTGRPLDRRDRTPLPPPHPGPGKPADRRPAETSKRSRAPGDESAAPPGSLPGTPRGEEPRCET